MATGKPIVHDSEYYILNAQHREKWAVEDKELDAKMAELRNTPVGVGASRSPCWGSRMHPTCKPP